MLSCKNLTRSFVDNLLTLAKRLDNYLPNERFKNKIMVNAFFEPSTRTSLSFESAMYKLGGKVITFNRNDSSLTKGETFEDTIKTLNNYADIMVLRHSQKSFLEKASAISTIPVINAGNGDGEHPTQALIDLYTIYRKFNNIENLNFLFIGDIKHSRTIHSLVDLLKLYPTNKINFLPFKDREPSIDYLYNIGISHTQIAEDICLTKDEVDISKFDVVYVTRLQKERSFEGTADIIVNKKFMEGSKEDCIIMHPLPRNEELSADLDNDKRSVYFDQMRFGVEMRMALLKSVIEESGPKL